MTRHEEALWILRNKTLIEKQYAEAEEWKQEIMERLPTGISAAGKVTGGDISDWTAIQAIKLERISKRQEESRFYLKLLEALEAAELPAKARKILHRHFYEGKGIDRVAKELRMTTKAAKDTAGMLVEAMTLLLEIYGE